MAWEGTVRGSFFFFFSSHIFDWSGGGLGLGGSEYIYIYPNCRRKKSWKGLNFSTFL